MEGNLCGELVRERRFCSGLVIKASPSNVDQGTFDGFSSSYPVHPARYVYPNNRYEISEKAKICARQGLEITRKHEKC